MLHLQQTPIQHLQHQQLLYGGLDTQTAAVLQPPKKRAYFPSSSSVEQPNEYARLQEKMVDTHHQHHHHQNNTTNTGSSRLGLRSGGGEIVEVQGGHIVRSTGRKDRHSKVCTAKGPRDRRVRLSAPTAIQFYDVQDRLGYDRPSKAVDWLIKKAKAAIDELAKLPAWNPTTASATNPTPEQDPPPQNQQDDHHHHHHQQQQQQHHGDMVNTDTGNTSAAGKRAMALLGAEQQRQLRVSGTSGENSSDFLPPSLDSDAIADTIKSFFPMGGASAETDAPAIQFHGFAPPPDLLLRTSSQSQDLRLSLQSFQDPVLLHHHHHNQQTQHQNHPTSQNEQAIFTGSNPLGFDAAAAASWSENQAADTARFQRIMAWNAGGDAGSSRGGGGGGFMFNAPPTPPFLQPLFGQNQFFTQRGPLQSSNTPSIRAWVDPSAITLAAAADHQRLQTLSIIHPSSIPGVGFASGSSGFTGYSIPARIQGEEEEHDGISDKPSTVSSDSRR